MPRKKKEKVELSTLEQEFAKKVEIAHAKINEQLKISEQAFLKAVNIADEMGVPFQTQITMWETDKYIPETFSETRESFLQEFDPDTDLEDYCLEDTESGSKLDGILGFYPVLRGYDETFYEGWQSDAWSSSSFYC